MANSPNDSHDRQRELPGAFNALGAMLRAGRSFSGRERNCCFLNDMANPQAGTRFANISAISGFDFPDDGRAIALVDWDRDGDQDVWVSNRSAPRLRFLRNDVVSKGHFVALRLVGADHSTNRDAIGTRVELVLDATPPRNQSNVKQVPDPSRVKLVKSLRAGEGFLSQSSKWLHFGLGDATHVTRVRVTWPSQTKDRVENFGPLRGDRHYELVQGTGTAREMAGPQRILNIAPSRPALPTPSSQVRLPLLVRLPVLNVQYTTFDEETRPLLPSDGQATLINLWSGTCRPCIAELSEFARRDGELRAAGLRVVALSVDHLSGAAATAEDARRLLDRIGLPFAVGQAPPGLISYLQRLHSYHSPLNREFPLPTSFLVDAEGQLAFIYLGQVSVDQLLRDVQEQPEDYPARFQLAASFSGRAIQHPVVEDERNTHEMRIRFHLAEEMRRSGHLSAAIEQYQTLLKRKPDLAKAHNNLALAYRQQGQLNQAQAGYERALQIDPNLPEAHNNLGAVLFRMGELSQAKDHYQQALRLDPDYLDAEMNLGILSERRGDLSQAEAHFRRVLRTSTSDAPKIHAKAELQLGIVAEKRGNLQDAVGHYENALRIDADHIDAYINLGVVSARLQHLAQAQAYFEQALRIDADLPDVHNNLGLLLEMQGRFAEAKAWYEKALQIDPAYREAQANLRNIQVLMDRNTQAHQRD